MTFVFYPLSCKNTFLLVCFVLLLKFEGFEVVCKCHVSAMLLKVSYFVGDFDICGDMSQF